MPNQIEDPRTSNALGVRIPQWIIRQLDKRSEQLSVENQGSTTSNENLLFRANRSAWIRMVSSVDLIDPEKLSKKVPKFIANYVSSQGLDINKAKRYFQDLGIDIKNASDLAKKFVLQGGVSAYTTENGNFSYNLRDGFPDAYNVAGNTEVENYGYRPMPGITSVRVQTQGKLGSIRAAEIQLKVWDKAQLDIIDALYFKLGYTMFLEWGHTNYYKENGEFGSTEGYSLDPFSDGLTKEDIYNKVSNNIRESEGNYDAMLGMVTNFNFTYNQEGGYDCTIKLISLGVLISNMKMNNPRVLPQLQEDVIRRLINTLTELEKQRLAKEKASIDAKNTDPANKNAYPPCIRDTEPSSTKKNGPTAYAAYGIKKNVNNKSYIFYPDGRYQTSGLNGNGRYSCNQNVLYIDGKSSEETKFTYSEVLLSATKDKKISGLKYDSKQEGYYVIKNSNNYSYFAIDKLKKLLPIESKKGIVAKLDVNSVQMLPSFNNNNVGVIDLLTNAIPKNGRLPATNITSDLKSGLGIKYFASERLQSTFTGVNDYIAAIHYNGIDRKVYFVSLEYGYFAKLEDAIRGLFGIGIDANSPTTEQDIQDAIKQAVIDSNTDWKLTEVSETTIDIPENEVSSNTFIAETVVTIKRNSTKKVQNGTDSSGNPKYEDVPIVQNWTLPIKIKFNDLSILKNFNVTDNKDLINPIDAVSFAKEQENQNVEEIGGEETLPEPALNASDIQKTEAEKYKSAFEVIVRTIQLYSLDKAISSNIETDHVVKKLSLIDDKKAYDEFTKKLFSSGLFASMFDDLISISKNKDKLKQYCESYDKEMQTGTIADKERMLLVRALFGFHFGLLGNVATAQHLFEGNLVLNFSELMSTYTVPYEFNQGIVQGTQLNHPVYMPLGFVIMILNHMCTIYDNNKPVVYLDFNHKSNICLSNAKHLSTNPYDVLIPFQGTDKDFASILEPTTLATENKKDNATGKVASSTVIKPMSGSAVYSPVYTPRNPDTSENARRDRISGGLLPFKPSDANEVYRGRTMNILISCDYLLRSVGTFTKSNGSGDVYVREFIEQILSDINKSLGDINVFRLAYDDAGNAIHIVDDQMTQNLENSYPVANETFRDVQNKSRLPLFGKGSIAKTIEIRTEISSKLSNMIAVSANANIDDQANLSKSTDSFGFYNTAYKDRYIPHRTEYTTQVTLPTDTMIRSTIQFNEAIKTFYGDAKPAEGSVGHATNYYIQRMSKIKTSEKGTRASAMIPVSLNFSMDGMSGFGMGQSFTIDPEFLPYTYNLSLTDPYGEQDRSRTVAFVMTGLDHTIEGNQWTSNVRTNMIYAKDQNDFNADKIEKLNEAIGLSTTGLSGAQTQDTNFVASNSEAKAQADKFLGRPLSDKEWSELVSATFAEAGGNQTERGYVMGVILNRVRSKNWGETVNQVLTAKNQFQSVTGTKNDPGPSINFVNGPTKQAADSIYGAAVNILQSVPQNYLYFTSAIKEAYGAGTDITFIDKLKKRGAQQIGNSWFSA